MNNGLLIMGGASSLQKRDPMLVQSGSGMAYGQPQNNQMASPTKTIGQSKINQIMNNNLASDYSQWSPETRQLGKAKFSQPDNSMIGSGLHSAMNTGSMVMG